MVSLKKIFLLLLCILSLLQSHNSFAILWEDLGLDLYKQIDSGIKDLQIQQYQYELSGQWQTNIQNVLTPIFEREWINCDIRSSSDIENFLGNTAEDQVAYIFEKCWFSDENPAPTELISKVVSISTYIKNTYWQKAQAKTDALYNVARTGIYNDGNRENSPFDLIVDLQDIDSIIFSEEIPYEWIEYPLSNQALQNFIDDNINDPLTGIITDIALWNSDEAAAQYAQNMESSFETFFPANSLSHNYVCTTDDNIASFSVSDVEQARPSTSSNSSQVWMYSQETASSGASWWWPFPWQTRSVTYNAYTDEWGCKAGTFFCIVIAFEDDNYGMNSSDTFSVEWVITRAWKHLEKAANTSLTQKKMTTNNFELGAIISDLPWTLRGFWLEVTTQPVPILEVQNSKKSQVNGDMYQIENLLYTYYKNNGLDYKRANDLRIFWSISGIAPSEQEEKIFQTSEWMPLNYVEQRRNNLKKFMSALEENNRLVSESVEKQIIHDDMKKFNKSFSELEQFVKNIEDFVKSVAWTVEVLEKIPTRSS